MYPIEGLTDVSLMFGCNRFTRVGVPIKAGEVAARHFKPDPVPSGKYVRCRNKIYRDLIDLTRFHARRL
jgi:hypothetical protein